MTDKIRILQIVSSIFLLVFITFSCDLFGANIPSTPTLIGTWESASGRVIFNDDGIFIYSRSGVGTVAGTYTYTKTHIRFTLTHQINVDQWIEMSSSIIWPWFDGREVSYRIGKWPNEEFYGHNRGKQYLSIPDIQGSYMTRQ